MIFVQGRHFPPFFLGILSTLLLLLGLQDRLASGDFGVLVLVLLLDCLYLLFEELLGRVLRLFLLEGANGKINLISVFLDQVGLEHFHLLALTLLDLADDLIELRHALPRQLRARLRHQIVL